MGIYERKIKSKIFIFVLVELIFSSVSVYTITYFSSNQVTYNNKASGLKATQVQTAIDELYNTCKNNTSGSCGSGNNIYFHYQGSSGDGSGIYKMPVNGRSLTKISAQGSPNTITPHKEAKNIFIY